MTALIGRTSPKFSKLQIEDVGGILRDIPVLTFGDVGIVYDEFDVSALQDIVKSVMSGLGSFSITITGPTDSSAMTSISTASTG